LGVIGGHWGSLHRATGWIDARVDSAWVYQLVVFLSSGVTTIATGSGLKIVPPCTSSWLPNKEDFSLDSWSSSSSSMIQSVNAQCSNWSSLPGFRFCSSRTKLCWNNLVIIMGPSDIKTVDSSDQWWWMGRSFTVLENWWDPDRRSELWVFLFWISGDRCESNSTCAQYVTLQIKIGWLEKSKHASLAQQNGFGPAFLQSLLRLV
jgi:hypothetical protein